MGEDRRHWHGAGPAAFTAPALSAMSAHAFAYSGGVMWQPPSGAPSYGSLYAHAIRLQHSTDSHGTLLASFEQCSGNGRPVYHSTDSGREDRLLQHDDERGLGQPPRLGRGHHQRHRSRPAAGLRRKVPTVASPRQGAGKYQVVNRTSGLALAVANASTADGVLIDQESTSTPSAQQWTISKIN
jgi:hypothetical protein